MIEFPFEYKVFITPLVEKNVYGDIVDITKDIDISNWVKKGGLGNIKSEVDNGNFDIGIFTYSNVSMTIVNNNGKFNQEGDYRSIFCYSRDLAKVRIEFFDKDGSNNITFKGLINDEATTHNLTKKTLKFEILSYDSILRKILVSAGIISNGDTFKIAFGKILNRVEILSILNVDESNINPSLNLEIDDGSYFDDRTSRDSLNEILTASNSVLLIDETDNIIIKERLENLNDPYVIYNDGDLHSRENIFNIKNYNSGLQRSFNSIKVNDIVENNNLYIETFNLKQKEFSFDFLTNTATISIITKNILNEFKAPKKEVEIEVNSKDFKDIELLDVVSFPYQSVLKLYKNDIDIAMYEQETYGNFNYPIELRELNLHPRTKYKVIAITKKPKTMKTVLKLRQTGITISDGYFDWFEDNEGNFILDNDNQRIEATNG